MDYKHNKSSVVILANQHNPTVFFGNFLVDHAIVDSMELLDNKSTIITPAFAHVFLKDGDDIHVNNNRFKIEGEFGDSQIHRAVNYIKALPNIKCEAIGINFEIEVTDYDIRRCFNENVNKFNPIGFSIIFHEEVDGEFLKSRFVVNFIVKPNSNSIIANFNFEYRYVNSKFSNIDTDGLIIEFKQNFTKSIEVLNELFG